MITKIVEKAISNRMIPALDEVISEDQTGFIPGRRISTNIRKILDAVKNSQNENRSAIIISCDYLKCFDRIEMNAVQKAMEQFQFSGMLRKWVQIMYSQFTVKVQNNGYFSRNIQVTRSVHQGAPASNALFLCVAELLAIMLKENQDIKKLVVWEVVQFLNQFADDMDVMMQYCQESFDAFLKTIDKFHDSTGFTLSYEKTTVYRLGSLTKTNARLYSAKKVNWTSEKFNALGVDIHQNEEDLQDNYKQVLIKAKNVLNTWEARSVSLLGRVNIINTLIMSLFVYKMTVLPFVSEAIYAEIKEMCEKYLWRGKRPKIKYDVLCRPLAREVVISLMCAEKTSLSRHPGLKCY